MTEYVVSWRAIRCIYGQRYVLPLENHDEFLKRVQPYVDTLLLEHEIDEGPRLMLQGAPPPYLIGTDKLGVASLLMGGDLAKNTKRNYVRLWRGDACQWLQMILRNPEGAPLDVFAPLFEDLLNPSWPHVDDGPVKGDEIAEFLGHVNRPWWLTVGVHRARKGEGPMAGLEFLPELRQPWTGEQVLDLFAWLAER